MEWLTLTPDGNKFSICDFFIKSKYLRYFDLQCKVRSLLNIVFYKRGDCLECEFQNETKFENRVSVTFN